MQNTKKTISVDHQTNPRSPLILTPERRSKSSGASRPIIVKTASFGNSRTSSFASTSSYRTRECYAGIAEFSVYVARSGRGRGVGTVAMRSLLDAVAPAGIWKLVSRILVENSASRRLMASMGFREVGIYHKHAKLDGQRRDVVIVERLIPEIISK